MTQTASTTQRSPQTSSLRSSADTGLSWLITILKVVCVTLFAFVLLVMVWQVVSRQILNDPPAWTGPAAQYGFIWLIFTGTTWMFAEREHIAVDFFAKVLRIDRSRTVEVTVQTVTLAFAALLLVWGGSRAVAITWTQAIPGLPFSTGMMGLALPVSGVLICLISCHHILHALRTGGVTEPATTSEGTV